MKQRNIAQDLLLALNGPALKIGAAIGFEADYNFATKRNALTRLNGCYLPFLAIDPANGEIPTRESFNGFHYVRKTRGIATHDGPKARNSCERCLSGGWQFARFTQCHELLIYK